MARSSPPFAGGPHLEYDCAHQRVHRHLLHVHSRPPPPHPRAAAAAAVPVGTAAAAAVEDVPRGQGSLARERRGKADAGQAQAGAQHGCAARHAQAVADELGAVGGAPEERMGKISLPSSGCPNGWAGGAPARTRLCGTDSRSHRRAAADLCRADAQGVARPRRERLCRKRRQPDHRAARKLPRDGQRGLVRLGGGRRGWGVPASTRSEADAGAACRRCSGSA